ncbi:MAG: methyltransferase family protein, partial [Promethearchaeota archaeon]
MSKKLNCMKGLEKLKEKLPDYQGKVKLIFLIVVFIVFLSSLTFQLIMDSLPRILGKVNILQVLELLTPIFGSLIVLTIGFILVYSFWRNRDKYLMKFGDLAYQKAFKFVVIGISMLISVIVHSFFPTDFILPYENNQNFNWYLANSIFDIILDSSIVLFSIRLIFCFLFVGLGLTVVRKALKTFGIDYMGLVYIFYPKESTLQNHEIYSILRHPTYHSLLLFSIGSIFFRCSIYSIIYFLIFLVGINIHIKLVEERELIQRFGEHYITYKENVPALFVR